jgi:hypothetical protein
MTRLLGQVPHENLMFEAPSLPPRPPIRDETSGRRRRARTSSPTSCRDRRGHRGGLGDTAAMRSTLHESSDARVPSTHGGSNEIVREIIGRSPGR